MAAVLGSVDLSRGHSDGELGAACSGLEVLGVHVVLGLIRHLRGTDNWAILSTLDLVGG
jgi:hypothetical protein